MRLTNEEYHLLAALMRHSFGAGYIKLLRRLREEATERLYNATGDDIGWKQGECQALSLLINSFEKADEYARVTNPRT